MYTPDQIAELASLYIATEPTPVDPPITGTDLATTLGLPLDEKGECPDDVFFNACLDVQSNEAVKLLPEPDRLRILRAAMNALGVMLSRGR